MAAPVGLRQVAGKAPRSFRLIGADLRGDCVAAAHGATSDADTQSVPGWLGGHRIPPMKVAAGSDAASRYSGSPHSANKSCCSGGQKFCPPFHEIIILLHDGVPDVDLRIPIPIRTARPNVAFLDDNSAERIRQIFGGRLAVVPIIPFLGGEIRVRERVRWLAAEKLERVDGPHKSTTIFNRRTREIIHLSLADRTFRQLDMPRKPEEPGPEPHSSAAMSQSLRDCIASAGRGPKTWKPALFT